MPGTDPHAWAPHLEALRPGALRWLESRGYARGAAEDLWQEISARFLRTGARPDVELAPEAYLWTSLRRAAARTRARWTPRIGEAGLVSQVDPAPSPVELVTGEERRDAVRAAVAQLPPVFRSVVERRFLRGQSVSEVADELAIPGTTVATRTHRGLALLRPRLARYRAGLVAFLGPWLRRASIASLIGAAVIGPTAQWALTEQHELPPVEPGEDAYDWGMHAPDAGFPYAEGFVERPLPEA